MSSDIFFKGDTFTAGRCRVFPLPFKIVAVNPVKPELVIEEHFADRPELSRTAEGGWQFKKRVVKNSVLLWHVAHKCCTWEHSAEPDAVPDGSSRFVTPENGACKNLDPVVEWSGMAAPAVPPVSLAAGAGSAVTTIVEAKPKGAGRSMKLTRTQSKSGKYLTFAIPGVRGQVHIAPKMVVGDPATVTEIEVSGVTFVEPNEDVVAADDEKAAKAAAKAEKAAAKAAAAQEKAAARAAKAQAAVEKAQARAAAALAKAQGGTKSEEAPAAEGSTQPEL